MADYIYNGVPLPDKRNPSAMLLGIQVGQAIRRMRGQKQPVAIYTGNHFKSFWDMSNWTVCIMANREISNTQSNYLYEYTMETLPDTLTIPYSLIESKPNNIFSYPLDIVIQTPHELIGKKFSKYSMSFPALSQDAVQYNPRLRMNFGEIYHDSIYEKDYFSGIGASAAYDLSDKDSIIYITYGEGSEVLFDTLKVCVINGSFQQNIFLKKANCLCASIDIDPPGNSPISGSYTLDFSNFFVELV